MTRISEVKPPLIAGVHRIDAYRGRGAFALADRQSARNMYRLMRSGILLNANPKEALSRLGGQLRVTDSARGDGGFHVELEPASFYHDKREIRAFNHWIGRKSCTHEPPPEHWTFEHGYFDHHDFFSFQNADMQEAMAALLGRRPALPCFFLNFFIKAFSVSSTTTALLEGNERVCIVSNMCFFKIPIDEILKPLEDLLVPPTTVTPSRNLWNIENNKVKVKVSSCNDSTDNAVLSAGSPRSLLLLRPQRQIDGSPEKDDQVQINILVEQNIPPHQKSDLRFSWLQQADIAYGEGLYAAIQQAYQVTPRTN